MTFSPGQFKSELALGGARQNLFEFRISFPASLTQNAGIATNKISFMARSASLPASNLPAVAVPYFGRTVYVAGDRQFDSQYQVSIINDEDFVVRNALESWSNAIKTHVSNIGIVRPADYKVDFEVIQYGKDSRVIKKYKFIGAYPVTVGDIRLDWEDNNSIEIFPCTFTLDWWESDTTDS